LPLAGAGGIFAVFSKKNVVKMGHGVLWVKITLDGGGGGICLDTLDVCPGVSLHIMKMMLV
jgi:hypothetical protein